MPGYKRPMTSTPPPSLELQVFGTPVAVVAGRETRLPLKRAVALLAYLGFNATARFSGSRVSRPATTATGVPNTCSSSEGGEVDVIGRL